MFGVLVLFGLLGLDLLFVFLFGEFMFALICSLGCGFGCYEVGLTNFGFWLISLARGDLWFVGVWF